MTEPELQPLPGEKKRDGRPGRTAAVLVMLLAVAAMFGPVLFSGSKAVVSMQGADLSGQFLYYRDFGFRQILQGDFPFWNPHIYSGVPFFTGFQSALLYPPNALHLVLPLETAINWLIALHLFLAGLLAMMWAQRLGLRSAAAGLAGLLFMFCAAHFLLLLPGHAPRLCTIAWTPLILFAVEGWIQKGRPSALLPGCFAAAMQVLAGHPQFFYYTALATGLYALFRSLGRTSTLRVLAGVAALYVGGVALSAVQLLPGLLATGEGVRSAGLPFAFASSLSLPPENLATLVAPGLFGDVVQSPYWGRGYLWEHCLFIGISGLFLALAGALYGGKNRIVPLAMAGICLILALGAHTPLYRLLWKVLPFFDSFRGTTKFATLIGLFLAVLAGLGLEALVRRRSIGRSLGAAALALALVLAVGAVGVGLAARDTSLTPLWSRAMEAIERTDASFFDSEHYTNPVFVRQAARGAAGELGRAALRCLILAALLFASCRSRRWAYVVGIVVVLEVFVFAKGTLMTFDPSTSRVPILEKLRASSDRDDRVLNLAWPADASMMHGTQDIWGYDPAVLGRYARLLHFAVGKDPAQASRYLTFTDYHPFFRMLRCRYVVAQKQGMPTVTDVGGVMPRMLMVNDYRVISNAAEAYAFMDDPQFDPLRTVVLEAEPDPRPAPEPVQTRPVVRNRTVDSDDIEVDLARPSILLITDAYARDWHARPLPGSVAQRYDVLPANRALRAIPLSAGRHRLRLAYRPAGFSTGLAISAASWIIFFALVVATSITRKKSAAL